MKHFVLRAQCHTANFVGVMVQIMYAPMDWVPFAVWSTIRVALWATIATIPSMPSQILRTVSLSTISGDDLEIYLISALLSPNWNGNVSAPQLPCLWNGYRHIKWPTACTQPWLTLMVGNSTEKERELTIPLAASISNWCSAWVKDAVSVPKMSPLSTQSWRVYSFQCLNIAQGKAMHFIFPAISFYSTPAFLSVHCLDWINKTN